MSHVEGEIMDEPSSYDGMTKDELRVTYARIDLLARRIAGFVIMDKASQDWPTDQIVDALYEAIGKIERNDLTYSDLVPRD